MIAPENPPGFVVRTEAQKAAWDNGYRLERGIEGGSIWAGSCYCLRAWHQHLYYRQKPT
ncbi:MAG TPA: hypothetical protein VJ376_17410 [Pseudomonadota bacterium]|nr:hypothetical protein [Pseudomonadota bacterium]